MCRSLTRRQLAADVALALTFLVVGQVELFTRVDNGYQAGPAALNAVIFALTSMALSARRLHPIATAVVVFGVHALPALIVPHTVLFWGTLVPMAVALYSAVRWGPRSAALPLLILPVAFAVTYPLHVAQFRGWEDFVFTALVLGSAWCGARVIGDLAAQRRALDDALRQLAREQEQRQQQVAGGADAGRPGDARRRRPRGQRDGDPGRRCPPRP